MDKNYEFWEKEHVNPDMLPQISIERPSSSIEMFLKFLKKNNLPIDGANVLSLGSGKGRNEIYMAKHGFNVVGIDYIDMAVKEAKKRAESVLGDGWSDNLEFIRADALDYLKSVESESYDYVTDVNFSIDIEDDGKRREMAEEVQRVLKTNGYLLFFSLHTSDPTIKYQVEGRETGMIFLEEHQKYEKLFDERSAKELYSKLEILNSESKIVTKKRTYLGEWIDTKLLYSVFRK
jgi:SAM-dependent methyltransferase